MATKREKLMLGALLLVGGLGGIGGYLVLPTFGTIQDKFVKIAEAETQVQTFTQQIQAMQDKMVQLKRVKELPAGLVVREYKPDTLQANIKGMVDQIVNLSTINGNELIGLHPWEASLPVGTAPKLDEKGQPIPEENPVQLQVYGYELVIRGSYDNVMGFLASMNSHNELIEINTIKMENETGENRGGGDSTNPFKPIKLTAKMVLFLQPEP